jgi:ABC-type uncharacterized transport system permease subunit
MPMVAKRLLKPSNMLLNNKYKHVSSVFSQFLPFFFKYLVKCQGGNTILFQSKIKLLTKTILLIPKQHETSTAN